MSIPMCALENWKRLWPDQERDPQDLIARIKTLMDRCEMINNEHCEHELRRRIVPCIPLRGKAARKTDGQALQDTLQ